MSLNPYYKILFFVIILSGFFVLDGQDRNTLEKDKTNNIEKIKYTRKLLESNRIKKEKNLSGIYLLNRGIKYRGNLIKNYEDELIYISSDIDFMEREIIHGREELQDLKNTYAKIVKASYRNLENEFWLMYILSSEDLNQSYRRYKYLQYINDYREELYDSITNTNYYLLDQIDSLNILVDGKKNTISNIESEKTKLLDSQSEKERLQRKLMVNEEKLLREIKEQEELKLRIEKEIRTLIEEEARKARAANRVNSLTPSEKIIDGQFGNNKGGLPWPTEQGIITGEYGERAHPVLKGIKIRSNGIDISTTKDSRVRSVFKGEVTKVIAILGANYTVIIKHGNYRTVYQNLVDVNVKLGDRIETMEYIGKLGSEDEEISKLHFELWNKMEAVNPQIWLSK